MLKLLKYFFFIILTSYFAHGQDSESIKMSSYEGLHFIVGFMENESNLTDFNKQLEQKIFISSNYDTPIKVSFGKSIPIDYNVSQNEVLTIDVSKGFENATSEIITNNVIEITSEFPISVYAYSSIPRSSDSYAAIPVANWGKEYVAVSMPNDQYNKITLDSVKDLTPRSSQILIMSAYDNTKVKIIPSSLTRMVKQVGQTYEITLNKGQCYLVQSWQYSRGQGDLTGTIVRSDKPIGVLSGHVRSALLQGFEQQPPDSKDHLIEMLMPTSAWGNTFVSIPFGTNPAKGDYFKIISLDPNAVVDIETSKGKQQINFTSGTSQIIAGLKDPAVWRSSSPVQLAQFMYRTGDTTETVFYDPSMVILPPVEQFVSRIAFNTPDESFVYSDGVKFTDHYVTIVAQPEALSNLKLDNVLVTSISNIATQKVFGTNLHWARISLSSGKHNLIATVGRFAGILFGVGRFDSYAMTLGCSLQNPFTEDSHPPTIVVTENCGKLQGTITDEISDESFGIYYAWVQEDLTKNYKWKIDPIASDAQYITFNAEPIDVMKDGMFVIDYMDKNGNKERYTYIYDGLNLSYNKDIILPNIDYNDSICVEIPIRNLGKRNIEFLKATLSADPRVTLITIPNAGSIINSGDSVRLFLCLNPKGNSESFYGKINVDFGCDLSIEINFRGELVALKLEVNDLDFGSVQVGNTKCDSIFAVNLGNSTILMTELIFDTFFDIDTVGLFPKLLNPGDTLFVKVCFSPDARVFYNDVATFNNEFFITYQSTIKGLGVAPLVKDLTYNFGNVRVGASKTLNDRFLNSGNQAAVINFDRFITKTHSNDGISQELESIVNLNIPSLDSFLLPLTFVPSDTLDYTLSAEYKTNWNLHPQLKVNVTGKGTIPVIRTQDVNFGTVEIYSSNELTPVLFFSEGNEALTVYSADPYQGDLESFTVDYTSFSNSIYMSGTSAISTIKFNPQRIGFHELIISVIHDAMPNYGRDTSYIRIVGTAVQPGSYDVVMNFENDALFSCVYETGKLKIKNNSQKVHLTDLRIDKQCNDCVVELLNFAPTFIETGETVEFDVRLYTERNNDISFDVTAKFFDLDSITNHYQITPSSGRIILDNFAPITYAAGDTVKVILSGKFNSDIDTLTSFYLSLGMKNEHLLIINEKYELILNNFSEKLKYNLNISQTKDNLEFFVSEDLIKIIKNVNWSVELTFLGLFSSNTKGDWKVFASSDKCYLPDEGNLTTILDSVCVFNVRHIGMDSANNHINIYPNPSSNTLRLKIILKESIFDGKVTISDNLGVTYTLSENVFTEKGISFLEYDISNFPNGSYIMNFESKNLKKNILFVIIR